jgi:signal transduction histidine kinase
VASEDLRAATLSQLAGTLGHDLKGPLVNLQMGLQMLWAEDDPQQREELHRRLDGELARAIRLVEGLLDFARSRAPQLAPTRLGAVVAQAASCAAPGCELELADLPPMPLDPDQQLRLFEHLFRNAVEAAGPSGRIRASMKRHGQGAQVRIEDSGPGIPPELREKVFEPLTTGRRRGLGLGLAVCKRIVEAHGGRLTIEDSELGGAALVVTC